MFLDKIISYKKLAIQRDKKREDLKTLKEKIEFKFAPRDFKAALQGEGLSLIAELKRGSPSKGMIKEEFDYLSIVKEYQTAGASAISVLTEEDFFKGHLNYLSEVKEVVDIPVLRKDFIIDSYQIYQSRAYGADAILLIANILSPKQLAEYLNLSKELDMEVLLEVHNKAELLLATQIECDIIGINNRELESFKVDLGNSLELCRLVPLDKIVVSESGIKGREDIQSFKNHHINAVLIGEHLIKSKDITAKIRELFR